MPVTLIITSQEGLIARIDGYDGPIPRGGEYIIHPPLTGEAEPGDRLASMMSVKTVTYGILARGWAIRGSGPSAFYAADEPFVEVYV